ncbi:hypothetical protein pb186bvf_015552 [Paramecium bursaria]
MNQPGLSELQGQEANNNPRICTLSACREIDRWIFTDCSEQIHLHGRPNQSHILNEGAFLEFAKKRTQLKDNHQFKYHMELIKYTVQGLDLFEMNKDYNNKEMQQIVNIIKTDYQKLDSQQINRILKQKMIVQDIFSLKSKSYNKTYCLKITGIKILQNRFNKQECIIKISELCRTSIIKIDYHKYQMMKNIQHLVEMIQMSKKIIQIENSVTIIKFTNDSKFLSVGDSKGQFYCFYTQQKFYQKFKYNAHTFCINDMISIDDDRILSCSFDESISITSIKQGKQLLLITKLHYGSINGIEFDKQNDIIISCSYDNKIKFFEGKEGKFQFEQQKAHKVYVLQMQLVQGNNLLSSGQHDLILWQIDYKQQQLIRIKVLEQHHFNFTSLLNDSRIVIVCERSIQLLDSNLNQLQKTNHNLILSSIQQQSTRQLNSLKYIVVQGDTSNQSRDKQMIQYKIY